MWCVVYGGQLGRYLVVRCVCIDGYIAYCITRKAELGDSRKGNMSVSVSVSGSGSGSGNVSVSVRESVTVSCIGSE